jgi:hypothetical protein
MAGQRDRAGDDRRIQLAPAGAESLEIGIELHCVALIARAALREDVDRGSQLTLVRSGVQTVRVVPDALDAAIPDRRGRAVQLEVP